MIGLAFTKLFLVWAAGILAIFLPIELYAATATPAKTDTFSEFVWWVYGVKPRRDGRPVPFRFLRRLTLASFLFALYLHFVFAFSYVPMAVLGVPLGGIMIYALLRERNE